MCDEILVVKNQKVKISKKKKRLKSSLEGGTGGGAGLQQERHSGLGKVLGIFLKTSGNIDEVEFSF